jgi:hypothetical protein
MKKILFLSTFSLLFLSAFAQQDSIKTPSKVLIIPYQSMMYFSDADPDISRFSKLNEMTVRNEMRNNVEANVYHQLLASFDAISLMRATSLNGEQDLNHIYAATRYTVYSREMKQEYMKEKGVEEKSAVKQLLDKFSRKSKDQTFWVSDSAVMLAMIGDPELFKSLNKKYNEKYILFISQFEINTNNKNSIEWMKQEYKREYVLHYNLFDKSGNLLRAETLTIKGGNENTMKEINDKYLIVLANRLKEILIVTDK